MDWDPLHANTMAKGSPQSLSCGSSDTAITTISVSLALIARALLLSIASRACTHIRVYACVGMTSNDLWLSLIPSSIIIIFSSQ